jgi:hypothetical protein
MRNFFRYLSWQAQINHYLDKTGTMRSLTTTTTALIAAMSVIATASILGTLTPQAFAQNTVDATQSNSATFEASQSISQTGGDDSEQSASQGFCIQLNQQNAAAGNDATNTGINAILGTADGDDSTGVDCS